MNKTFRSAIFATAGALSAIVALPAQADYAEANVNNDAARLAYGWTTQREEGQVQLEGALLFAEEEDNERDVKLASFGLAVIGDAGVQAWDLKAGLGARIYAGQIDADPDDVTGFGVGLGGEFSLRFPQMNRLGLSSRFYYAPDILAFNDVAEIIDFALRVEYEVLRNANLYLGYRVVRAESDDTGDSVDIDRGVNVGLRINF